jgi:lysophospholipase L1-like esterase
MKTFLTLVLIGLLLACGGGGSSGPTATRVLEVYGDSTAYAVDGSDIAPGGDCPAKGCTIVAPPSAFVQLPGWAVHNKSVGGLSALDLLQGKPAAGVLPWPQQVQRSPAVATLIALGINDGFASDAATYAHTLTQLATVAREQGKWVIFQTPNPTHEPRIDTLTQTMRSVAAREQVPLIDQDAFLAPLIGTSTASPITFFAAVHDGIHPNAATYKAMGEYTQRRLAQILIGAPQ